MSDEPTPDRLTPITTVEPDAVVPPVEPVVAPEMVRERRDMLPVAMVIGFVVLAAAIGYLYVRPSPLLQQTAETAAPDQSGAISALRGDLNALKAQVAALDGQEKQDAAQWQASPGAAAQSQPAPATTQATDSGLTQQVAALSDRLNALAARQTPPTATPQDLTALSARVDGLADRETHDGESVRQDLNTVQKQIADVTGQMQGLPKLAARSDRLGQILHAQEALRAGLPLGPIDGAPTALTRFETTPPPTEAALRLAFPAAAKAADEAGAPLPQEGRFWHRVWLRVQNLVVVRRGDQVLVGDPTGGVLAHAQRLLDAGDLPGTLMVLGTLSDRATAAMAPWVSQAKTLVDARQALAQMAAG